MVSFDATASGGDPPYSFAWDFGEGNVSAVEDPTHAFEFAGLYPVTVTVTDVDGNVTDASDDVTVASPPPPPPPKSWMEVIRFNGSTDKTTDSFFIGGERFRLNWTATAENEFGSLSIFVYKLGQSLWLETIFISWDASGTQSDTSVVFDSGEVYLDIGTANLVGYEIVIEEYTDGLYTPPPETGAWVEIDRVTGSVDKTTDTFTISGEKFRLAWTATAQNEFGYLSIFVYKLGESLWLETVTVSWDAAEVQSDTSVVFDSGEVYLDIGTANLAGYEIVIEEYTDGSTPPPPPPTGVWVEVIRFNGSTDKTTDSFQIVGSKFRLTWNATAENEFGYLSIFVYKLGESLWLETVTVSWEAAEVQSDTTVVFDSGEVYLAIGAANLVSYEFIIEEYTDESTPPRPPPPAGDWVEVIRFNGSTDKTTDSFQIVGSKFRLSWNATAQNEFGRFTLRVYEVGASFWSEYVSVSWDSAGEKSDITVVFESGEFYLDISEANLSSWGVVVEEWIS